jgi:hypothetical protein
VAVNQEPSKIYFLTRTLFGSASKILEIEQWKVSLESRLLYDELNLHSLAKYRRITFKFDRGSDGLASRVAAELENRISAQRPLTLTESS